VELVTYTDGDIALTEAIECNSEMMSTLGGPVPRDDIPRVHRMRLDGIANGDTWWFVIVPEPNGPAAGTIGIWKTDWRGTAIHEVGWMVLPEFQGRGLASAALAELITRGQAEPGCERLHAFPSTDNAPSNALCRKFGFENTEQVEVKFRDRPLRCNHWELDVSADPGSG
jgi:RimJ/RimL family protein N-acetyltransferase